MLNENQIAEIKDALHKLYKDLYIEIQQIKEILPLASGKFGIVEKS